MCQRCEISHRTMLPQHVGAAYARTQRLRLLRPLASEGRPRLARLFRPVLVRYDVDGDFQSKLLHAVQGVGNIC